MGEKHMEKNGMVVSKIRRLKFYLIVDLVLFIIIGLACWFGHYRTLEHFSNGLLIGGCIILGIGFFSLIGGLSGRHDFGYQYLRNGSINQKACQDVAEMNQSYSFVIEMSIIGVLPLTCGMLLKMMI
ncbi:MAG: hypothetical protein EHM45_15800 [Desulfobacteraceae bacterium]|nr:MAG: hypothetical protein EHM45_15800 [Desulfobacteraceae bacterium]